MRLLRWTRLARPCPESETEEEDDVSIKSLRQKRMRYKRASWWGNRILDLLDRDPDAVAEALRYARDARRQAGRE